MALQPNRQTLETLLDSLVNGDRNSSARKLYVMRQDHLDIIDKLRGGKTRVAMLRSIIDEWRDMKIEELKLEVGKLENTAA
ncbi:MAG: hypothetical protein ACPG8W_08330 [Candidatus Promineifilaceae bacterium]